MEKKIGKSAKLLIISDLFYSLTSIFVETFLVAYFLKITSESITTIALYYIIIYFIRILSDMFWGKVIKRYPSKAKNIISSGIIVRAFFILLIVILSEKIATNFVWIAIFFAFGESLYWSAHEVVYIDVTTNNNRKNYMSIKKITGKIISIISPIILGTSIELYTLSKIAIYVFILTVIQVIITFFIKTNIQNKEESKYSLRRLLEYITQNKLRKVRDYYLSSIAYGIIESSIGTLIVIITIMTFKTSFNLGVLTTIFNIFSMLALTLYNKFYNKKTARKTLILCATVIVLGVVGLLVDIDKITLIIYNFCYITAFSIFDAVYNTRKGDLVKECNIEDYREEHVVNSAITICIGRIIGYALMLVVSFTNSILFFKILLAVITSFAPVYCYLNLKTLKD